MGKIKTQHLSRANWLRQVNEVGIHLEDNINLFLAFIPVSY